MKEYISLRDIGLMAVCVVLSLSACSAEAALNAWEAAPRSSPEPTPIITPPPYQEHCIFPDERVASALAESLGETVPTREPEESLKPGAAELYVEETVPAGVPLTAGEWESLLTSCAAGRVDPSLALAVMETESGFDRTAVNGPCYGLMQLHTDYFPADLTPEENIAAGVGYLAECLDRYDELEAGLTAYRWGHDNGDRDYADKVLTAQEERFAAHAAQLTLF